MDRPESQVSRVSLDSLPIQGQESDTVSALDVEQALFEEFYICEHFRTGPSFVKPNGWPTPLLLWLRIIYDKSLGLVFIFFLGAFGGIPLGLWFKIDANLCPNIIDCQGICVVETDPDIAGLGVRIATYIQTILNIIVLGFGSETGATSTAYRTLMLTSLAIVLTLGIFSLRTRMSLNHLMIAFSLLTITMLPTHILQSTRVQSPGIFLSQQLRLGIYAALGWWLTLKMPCLGADPQCNMCTKTSFFGSIGLSVSASHRSTRLVFAFWVGLMWLRENLWFYGPRHYIAAVLAMFSKSQKKTWNSYIATLLYNFDRWEVADLARRRERSGRSFDVVVIATLCQRWYANESPVGTEIQERRWRSDLLRPEGASWAGRVWYDAVLAVRVPRCQRTLVALGLAAILIRDTERSVKLNLSVEGDKWAYGQIFALVATVPSVADAAKMLSQLGRTRRSRDPQETGLVRAKTF